MLQNIWQYIIDWLNKHGIDSQILNSIVLILTLLGFLIAIGITLWRTLVKIILLRNQRILNSDLGYSNFSKQDVERATQFYIPTYYQNVSPSEDEEPGRKYIASARNKLIPLFIKNVFISRNEHKFYMILADTGMGKTTFMINLYLKYINRIKLIPSHPKKLIRLYPLGASNTLEQVKAITNKQETILLLDAFDEDVKAMVNYRKRLDEILDVVKDFKTILITCRTQFFPSQKEEPYETGYFSYGSVNEEYKFQKLYISVFSNADIKKYVHKRFNWIQFKQRKIAFSIAKKSPDLIVRPMLLYHISDLVNSKKVYKHTSEIYEVLIDKWIEREYNKPNTKSKFESYNRYYDIFYSFSYSLAIDLYNKRIERRGFYIASFSDFEFSVPFQNQVLKLAMSEENSVNVILDHKEIRLFSDIEKSSRSLLNRDIEGKYKFSHRSIMEYFLALELFSNPVFYQLFQFEGMNATSKFLSEFLLCYFQNCEGQYEFNDKSETLHHLDANKIPEIKSLKVVLKHPFNILLFSYFKNLTHLSISNFDSTSILYLFYCCYYINYLKVNDFNSLEKLEDIMQTRERLLLIEGIQLEKLLNILFSLSCCRSLIEYFKEVGILNNDRTINTGDSKLMHEFNLKDMLITRSLNEVNFFKDFERSFLDYHSYKSLSSDEIEQRTKSYKLLNIRNAEEFVLRDHKRDKDRIEKNYELRLKDLNILANEINFVMHLKAALPNCTIIF